VTFELSIEGGPFSLLGYGTRSGNAWRLNNPGIAPPPARGVLRVRGYFAGAGGGDATSVIETTAEVSSYELSFTDAVVRSRATLIRAIHLTQLRSRIDGVRMAVGLTPVAWTDARLRPGMTVRAAHVNELRTALADAYRAARRVPPASLNSSLSPRASIIRAVDIDDLRSNVRLLEFYIAADTPW
jgi:hypothetical protein